MPGGIRPAYAGDGGNTDGEWMEYGHKTSVNRHCQEQNFRVFYLHTLATRMGR